MSELRPAIVTGASSGIGRETAVLLGEAGCAVLLVARRKEKLEAVAELCAGGAWILAGDLSEEAFCHEVIEAGKAVEGNSLPILVNAAGVAAFGPTHEMPVEEIDRQLDVNLRAAVLLCREAIPWLRAKGGGDILNVGSIASVNPFGQAGAYVASKFGLLGFTKSLSNEYRKEGIRVTALLPGSTDTELWQSQSFSPPKEAMLSARAVAEAIRDAVLAPRDRSFDEILLMPPMGIL